MGQHLLYLVRHGQYITDVHNRKAGSLTALGRQQARATARRLAELPISAIYHSDIQRAVETSAIISAALGDVPVSATRLLREMSPPVTRAMRHLYGANVTDFQPSVTQGKALFKKFFVPSRSKQDRLDVLVAHGNLIRYLVRLTLNDKAEHWSLLGTSNCGVTVISIGKTRETRYLIRFNDVGHLPASKQSDM